MVMTDLVGKTFGDLKIIAFSHKVFRSKRQGYYHFWKCLCACGNETIVLVNNLKNGNTKSCGCKSSRLSLKERATKHGLSNTKTYNSWRAMKDRCYCVSHGEYKRYGQVGIKVCERWKDSYENFLLDMGERPPNHSLDRINPFGDYSPKNCRWATPKEQANNKKSHFLKKLQKNEEAINV